MQKQILALIIIIVFISSLAFVSYQRISETIDAPIILPINNSMDLSNVPFYQRIVLVAIYNEMLCPDIALQVERNNTNTTVPFERIVFPSNSTSTQWNNTDTVYFAKLGMYDTNNDKEPLTFRWVNAIGGCVSRYQILTNNDFLALLMESGVEVVQKATETNVSETNMTNVNVSNVSNITANVSSEAIP